MHVGGGELNLVVRGEEPSALGQAGVVMGRKNLTRELVRERVRGQVYWTDTPLVALVSTGTEEEEFAADVGAPAGTVEPTGTPDDSEIVIA